MIDPTRGDEPTNPYEAPKSEGEAGGPSLFPFSPYGEQEFEAMRTRYLAHETTVRTIGMVYYIMAGFSILNAVLLLGVPGRFEKAANLNGTPTAPLVFVRVVMVIAAVFGIGVSVLFGYSLRRFMNWARLVIVVLSAIGMLGIAFMTIPTLWMSGSKATAAVMLLSLALNAVIVVFLMKAENNVVFSREYRRIIEATPTIQPVPGQRDRIILIFSVIASLLGVLAQGL